MSNSRKAADRRILIIEDDLQLAKTIANLLNHTGEFETYLASCGSIGIQKAFQLLPDMVLCDIGMSDIDGYQVFKTLKESSLTSMIPFVFLTGKSELDDIRLGMQLGADDYIVKPFQNDELLMSIKTRLEKYEKMVEMSMENFNNLLNLAPNPIFIHDKTKLVKVNPPFTKFFGYDNDDIKGMSICDLAAEQEKKKLSGYIQKSLSGLNGDTSHETVLVTAKGEDVSTKIFSKSSIDIKGHPIVIGFVLPARESEKLGIEKEQLDGTLKDLSSAFKKEEEFVSPDLAEQLKSIYHIGQRNEPEVKAEDIRLSKREKEVLYLACKGLSIKQIADLLFISDRTVEKHRTNLMHKTHTRNIVELIIFAIKNNLIEI